MIRPKNLRIGRGLSSKDDFFKHGNIAGNVRGSPGGIKRAQRPVGEERDVVGRMPVLGEDDLVPDWILNKFLNTKE